MISFGQVENSFSVSVPIFKQFHRNIIGKGGSNIKKVLPVKIELTLFKWGCLSAPVCFWPKGLSCFPDSGGNKHKNRPACWEQQLWDDRHHRQESKLRGCTKSYPCHSEGAGKHCAQTHSLVSKCLFNLSHVPNRCLIVSRQTSQRWRYPFLPSCTTPWSGQRAV